MSQSTPEVLNVVEIKLRRTTFKKIPLQKLRSLVLSKISEGMDLHPFFKKNLLSDISEEKKTTKKDLQEKSFKPYP